MAKMKQLATLKSGTMAHAKKTPIARIGFGAKLAPPKMTGKSPKVGARKGGGGKTMTKA